MNVRPDRFSWPPFARPELAQFMRQYKVGRTKLYEEINAGRLEARKIGTKTLIACASAERWFRSLPRLRGEK